MLRRTFFGIFTVVFLIVLSLSGVQAQEPDGFALYDLNVRSGPGSSFSMITLLPAGTGLMMEARSGDTTWVLGHTADGTFRGWVSDLYVRYRDGFSPTRLPVSAEVIGVPMSPAPQDAPVVEAAPPGMSLTATTLAALNVRRGPNQDQAIIDRLPAGVTVVIEGRDAGEAWALVHTLDGGTRGWVTTEFIRLPAGVLWNGVPVSAETVETPESPAVSLLRQLPVVAVPTTRVQDIYQRGLARGNHPDRFSKVGDCQSIPEFFLGAFDRGEYTLGPDYAHLQTTIDHFAGSFVRESASVWSGFNAYAVLDPTWADPSICAAGEAPMACEYRLWQPSFVIISLEVWHGELDDYTDNLRQVVDFWIAHDVVPILATKADNREDDWSINVAIAALAQEYNLPLWNFLMAAQPLPGYGLTDGFHLSYARCNFNDPAAMQNGWPWRNLTALQSLDAVWRGVGG
ncbi:MAG: SH3 domain-containing protein [Chloroflexi bacterium]|nr:SH3 domain-containing protein [Chloroflexota bacterium]